MNEPEYQTLKSEHGCYGHIAYGVRIQASFPDLPELLKDEEVKDALYRAQDLVKDALMAAAIRREPEERERIKREREEILSCFPARIYVEEIPNGYSSQPHSRHFPWFIVTTAAGRFKVGSRKRVIHLEWTEVPGAGFAENLFPDEDTTKYDKVIHAWTREKLAHYVAVVMASAETTPRDPADVTQF